MKRMGLKSKRDLGNACPCCGPWKLDVLDRKRERAKGRSAIAEGLDDYDGEAWVYDEVQAA